MSLRPIKINLSIKYFILLVILFICAIILYVLAYMNFQTLVASLFAIFFFIISLQLYVTVKKYEKDSENMDQTLRYMISTFISSSSDKFAYKLSAISAMFFLTVFIFVSILDNLTLSTIMQDLAIIGGIIALHIFYIIDKATSEPIFLKMNLIANFKKVDNGKLLRTEAIITSLSTIHEEELDGYEIIVSDPEQRNSILNIIFLTSIEKSNLAVGDKIRILGNWYCEKNDYLMDLGLKNSAPPFMLIIDGYGELEEVPFLTKELITKLANKR